MKKVTLFFEHIVKQIFKMPVLFAAPIWIINCKLILIVNLLKLILVEKIIMQTMKLVEYYEDSKYLLVNLKTENENEIKERDNKIKALEDEMKKFKLQLTKQDV